MQSIGSGIVTVTGPQGEQQVSLTGDAETRRALRRRDPGAAAARPVTGAAWHRGPASLYAAGTVPGLPLGQLRQNLRNGRHPVSGAAIPTRKVQISP